MHFSALLFAREGCNIWSVRHPLNCHQPVGFRGAGGSSSNQPPANRRRTFAEVGGCQIGCQMLAMLSGTRHALSLRQITCRRAPVRRDAADDRERVRCSKWRPNSLSLLHIRLLHRIVCFPNPELGRVAFSLNFLGPAIITIFLSYYFAMLWFR
mgnify:CR=1 FL=1